MTAQILRPIPRPVWQTLCRTCLRNVAVNREFRRPIHLSTLRKRAEAEDEWELRAKAIKNGQIRNLWDILKERGYVKDIAGTDEQIRELMRIKRIGAYVGIDPTAASLHLGHLLPLMPLFWMYMHGHRAITVVGGATAKIGDPTGLTKTRDDISSADRTMYVTKIHYQLKRMWQNVDKQAARFKHEKKWAWNRELLNNTSWHGTTPFYMVVNRLFKGMRLGPLLSRDSVKKRLATGDGMSLGEFVYPMLQAWDWWEMYSGPKGVNMQIGGSDQYGNIVAGLDAIKILRSTENNPDKMLPNDLKHTPVGFTVPLLTDASGVKFGKTAGNALWLDPFLTSSSDLYGYFMRRPDSEVEKLLKLFTFIPLDKIATIMKEHNEDPSKRHAHHTLAFEVLALVHGLAEAEATKTRHMLTFATNLPLAQVPTSIGEVEFFPTKGTTPASAELALNFRSDIKLPRSLILGPSIARILYAAGLADSATDANRLIAHRGAYVGGAPGRRPHENLPMRVGEITYNSVKSWFQSDTEKFLIDGKLLVLRRGKHFVRIVEMVSDEEWEASGRTYPGEGGKGRMRMLRDRLTEASRGTKLQFTPSELARVAEEVKKIERDQEIELADADESKPRRIEFPARKARAGDLVDSYTKGTQAWNHKSMDIWRKTFVIDKVLKETKQAAATDTKRKLAEFGPAPGKKSDSFF
ncbi:tRNA synthetase class I [Xylaria sp. CBS 124048]|nr:tRNA synthetase class I [Xylaria sp. CBS 124048]